MRASPGPLVLLFIFIRITGSGDDPTNGSRGRDGNADNVLLQG